MFIKAFFAVSVLSTGTVATVYSSKNDPGKVSGMEMSQHIEESSIEDSYIDRTTVRVARMIQT